MGKTRSLFSPPSRLHPTCGLLNCRKLTPKPTGWQGSWSNDGHQEVPTGWSQTPCASTSHLQGQDLWVFLGLYKVCKVLWAGCGVIRCWHGRAWLLVPGCGNIAPSHEPISCCGCWGRVSGEVVHRRENATEVGEWGQKACGLHGDR